MPDDVVRMTELPELPQRPDDSHKGSFGSVLVVGGSRGMSGAVALAGLGALRGGAGLVFLAVPRSVLPIVASIEPSYLTVSLPEDDHGRISREAQLELVDLVPKHSVIALGPGLGQSHELDDLVHWLFTTADVPMVIDADGLNALARMREKPSRHPAPRILTPHPGEFARLLEVDVPTVQQNREELAAGFARQHGIVLLLKGAGTVITDGVRLAVNTTGNGGMATGGTGDVLTGLVASLVAQRMEPFEAAQLAAHLHGLAGDLAAADLSKPGLIASDLPRFLGQAWKSAGG